MGGASEECKRYHLDWSQRPSGAAHPSASARAIVLRTECTVANQRGDGISPCCGSHGLSPCDATPPVDTSNEDWATAPPLPPCNHPVEDRVSTLEWRPLPHH